MKASWGHEGGPRLDRQRAEAGGQAETIGVGDTVDRILVIKLLSVSFHRWHQCQGHLVAFVWRAAKIL